jgi:hypothetical protein
MIEEMVQGIKVSTGHRDDNDMHFHTYLILSLAQLFLGPGALSLFKFVSGQSIQESH